MPHPAKPAVSSATSTAAVSNAYLHTAQEVTLAVRVVPSEGLRQREVAKRQRQQGPNVIAKIEQRPLIAIFFDRFKDPLVLFLLLAAVLSLFLREVIDAIMIAIIIVLDASLSLLQVWRTERTLKRLHERVQQFTTVVRAGRTERLPASYLVVGDIIELRAGERIPADARLLKTNGLQVAEAALTGEARDVQKSTAKLTSRTPLGNRRNMVYLGTIVTNGSGRAVVTATGARTEFGRIAQMLKVQPSPASPLRKKLHQAGLQIAWLIVVLVGITSVIGLFTQGNLATTLRTAIALVVSAIPEDLTIILTVALTVGVVRILRKRGVVRELSSAETLGAATVICTDKTGTITQGNMTAEAFDSLQGSLVSRTTPPTDPLQTLALEGFALATDAHRTAENEATYIGSTTERTALAFVESVGVVQSKLRSTWRLRDSLHFSSEWKYRATLHDHPTQGSQVLFVAGAPEVLLDKSSHTISKDFRVIPLTSKHRATLAQRIDARASRGERLIAMAVQRHLEQSEITHDDITELTFLGVLVITDPIRSDIRESITATHHAGVAVKLITGDYEATARAVARDVGLTVTTDAILSGDAIHDLSDEELTNVIDATTVFARVSPLDKQRIIRALQKRGHVVAMTGDGVNDAVALKSADIGVAMGSGKDIAKDAADLVLLDDSFTTIVQAIREGRVIRDNVRKVIAFLLSTNTAEVVIFIVSSLAGWPLPLLPAQILWINLVTDGTSDLALSLEPDERNVMKRAPEHPTASLIGRPLLLHIATSGAIMSVATLILYWYLGIHLALDLTYVRTMTFTFVSVSSLLSTWSFRSLTDSIYRRGLWQNPWISLSIGFSFLLQLLAIYLPVLQRFFDTVSLMRDDWVIIMSLSLLTVILIDLRKWYIKSAPATARVQSRPPTRSAPAVAPA